MKIHSFTIVAPGQDMADDQVSDRFFEAGCDDATIVVQMGLVLLELAREARTFSGALVSALRDVDKAGAGTLGPTSPARYES